MDDDNDRQGYNKSQGILYERESQSDQSWFDIFGFGKRNVLNNNLTYGLTLALPQCSCKRVESRPLKFKIEVPPNKQQKPLPKHIKGERCSRFNHWWLKCCQSAILKQSGIYWNLIQLFDVKLNVNGKETTVCDLVLGNKTTLAITLDIRRTYPSLKFFTSYGRRMLRRILLAYAFFDPDVGYVQGLNFIVANLLWHSNEEQAFWALISLMYLYDMRCMFLPGLPGVFRRCEILDKCMERKVPRLHRHLKNIGFHIPMISFDWLMTLCANSIPIKPLGRLWDSFFSEGWIAIFRFILYRLNQFQDHLTTMTDIADIMKVIKYGNTNTRWSLIELLPGFGSSSSNRRHQLIMDAYSMNPDNLTNDPNQNCNELDWFNIVEESLKFNLEPKLIHELELSYQNYETEEPPSTENPTSRITSAEGCLPEVTYNVGPTLLRPAVSSSNYLSLKSKATPGDRGEGEGSDGTRVKDVTSSGSGLPVADLREAEVNKGDPCSGRRDNTGNISGSPSRIRDEIEQGHIDEQQVCSDPPPTISNTGSVLPIELLNECGYGEVSLKLMALINDFKDRLNAIGVSKAYLLHLRALNDE